MKAILSFLQKHFSAICYPLQMVLATVEYQLLDLCWALKGYKNPSAEDVELVVSNVTFMFKSFERQKQANALYHSIRKYYPGARIVIADDSSKPLDIEGENLHIIQMSFNSGLSKGLNLALEEVKTPFMLRMDDDELLTRRSDIARELRFLLVNPEVDIIGIPYIDALLFRSLERSYLPYFQFSMKEAPLPLKIPLGTRIDDSHIVLGKVPNNLLARTESIRKVGWDDNIRMIDHHDFFFRAAGVLVSVISTNSVVFHNHNFFSPNYNRFRNDWKGDAQYIRRTRYSNRTKNNTTQNGSTPGKNMTHYNSDGKRCGSLNDLACGL